MDRLRQCAIALALIAAFAAAPAHAADIDIPKKLSNYEALDLVSAAIYRHKPGVPELHLHVEENPSLIVIAPGLVRVGTPFYPVERFGQYIVPIGDQQADIDWYAVNPWTGDVWDSGDCKKVTRLTSSRLKMRQAEIKKRFTKQELKQYERLRDLNPGCPII